jgi:hypothetical protein
MKSLHKILLTISFILVAYTAYSQTDSLSVPGEKTKPADSSKRTSSFKFGLSYLSNNVFMGRTDTVQTPIIVPELKYTLKSGIFFSGSLDFLPSKKKNKLDGGDISAGYDFDITSDLSGGISYAKLFYSTTSTQIAASVSSTFNANFTYDIGNIISPSVSADYNINKKGIGNDIFLNVGLTHDFITAGIFGDKDILLISPTVTANTGTQNFYDAYLTKKKLKTAQRTAAQNALFNKYINQLSQYVLLDYELSVPLEYKAGHFIFQFIPTYAIVKNQLPKQVQAKISDQPSIFYFQTGVSLKF